MQVGIAGVGAWGPGFSSLDEYFALHNADTPNDMQVRQPKPERIPSRERRRSPLMVKLAVEVAEQACAMANIEPAEAHSVFMSGVGDADITDYMCRVLSGPDKLLSPTKFHNSVHNAAAGIWSISTSCEKPATFVASMENSFVTALMESVIQVQTESMPVLLVMTDIAMPEPFMPMHPIDQMLGVAVLLTPVQSSQSDAACLATMNIETQASSQAQKMPWPVVNASSLQRLYEVSPTARSLCLLDTLAASRDGQDVTTQTQLQLPLSEGIDCTLSIHKNHHSRGDA